MWAISRDEIKNQLVSVFSDDYVPHGELTEKFRLLDEEGIVMFEGYSSPDAGYEPLEEFGEKYGCVDIEYWSESEGWQSL